MRSLTSRLLTAAALAGLLVAAAAEAGGGPKTQLVSRQSESAGGAPVDEFAGNPSVSANGRHVAFVTAADNLGGPLDTDVTNIYAYDRERKKVELVSRRSGAGVGADGPSSAAAISANGRYVAFSSDADNLGGPIDTDVSNIYVYDRERKRVELASRRSNQGSGGDANSFSPSLSRSGRHVTFLTAADNLGGPLDTDVFNVYVYDRERKRTQLVSRRSGANGAGADGASSTGSLSGSGRFVAFETSATNLGGPIGSDPMNVFSNVYVYDRERKKVELVSRRSRGAGGEGGDDSSGDPFISENGRFVGFESNAQNLGGPLNTNPLDFDDNIYVYDRERKKVELVSRRSKGAGGEGADDDSEDAVLSATGRFVVFETDAQNLGGPLNPANTDDNAYLYDRKRDRVELIGRASGRNGEACDDDCEDPYVSTDGSVVAFEAEADNFSGLALGDFDHVFVRVR